MPDVYGLFNKFNIGHSLVRGVVNDRLDNYDDLYVLDLILADFI